VSEEYKRREAKTSGMLRNDNEAQMQMNRQRGKGVRLDGVEAGRQ